MKEIRLLLSLVIVIGLVAGALYFMGMIGGSTMTQQIISHSWSPRNYVAAPGDCFVPPQGDPLYDQHYAENVNPQNCGSFIDQSRAWYINAQTNALNAETNRQGAYLRLFIGTLIGIAAFFGWAISRKA